MEQIHKNSSQSIAIVSSQASFKMRDISSSHAFFVKTARKNLKKAEFLQAKLFYQQNFTMQA